MFRTSVTLAALVVASSLGACGGSDRNTVTPTTGIQDSRAGSGSGMMGQCPTDMLKDVTVTLTDTDAGINVDFVTANTGKIETLRTMVQHMAAMHSGSPTGGSCCATGGGMMGGTGSGGCDMHGGTGGGMMGGSGGGMMGGGHDAHHGSGTGMGG